MTDKVVGVFLTDREASEAIEDLKRYGYSGNDISIISKNREEAEAISEQTGTKAPEGAAGGATAGGILGGVGGLLVGIGALAIPGIGPLLAAGPIATTLAGIAVGATGGGLVGGLIGLGIPEEEARSYDEHVGGGRLLVIVEASEQHRTEVEEIFRRHYALNYTQFGAEKSTSNLQTEPRHEEPAADYSASADENRMNAAAAPSQGIPAEPSSFSDGEKIQLRAEQLDIDKHTVRTGEVSVRKEIVHEEKTITVPVMHEEVVIERRAVHDEESGQTVGRNETIRIPVSEERIEVSKHNVVTQEVDVSTRTVEGMQRVEDTVKREEVRVDRTGQAPTSESTDGSAGAAGHAAYGEDGPVGGSRMPESRPVREEDLIHPASSLPEDTAGLPPRSERPRR